MNTINQISTSKSHTLAQNVVRTLADGGEDEKLSCLVRLESHAPEVLETYVNTVLNHL